MEPQLLFSYGPIDKDNRGILFRTKVFCFKFEIGYTSSTVFKYFHDVEFF